MCLYESERDKDKKNHSFYKVPPAQSKKQNHSQKTQTQGATIMNINPQFQSVERPSTSLVVEDAIDYILHTFIKPREDQLDEEELTSFAMISIMLKEIGEKAEAYYQLQEQGYVKNPNSLN